MIKDEVNEAAGALGVLIDVAFNGELDTWEKMAPGVISAVNAINECKDIAALGPADRDKAIIDTLITTIYNKKNVVITYTDEVETPE